MIKIEYFSSLKSWIRFYDTFNFIDDLSEKSQYSIECKNRKFPFDLKRINVYRSLNDRLKIHFDAYIQARWEKLWTDTVGDQVSLLGNREQGGYMLGILIATAAGEKLAILSRLRVASCHKYGYITSPCHYCSTSFLREARTARRNHRERVSPISSPRLFPLL